MRLMDLLTPPLKSFRTGFGLDCGDDLELLTVVSHTVVKIEPTIVSLKEKNVYRVVNAYQEWQNKGRCESDLIWIKTLKLSAKDVEVLLIQGELQVGLLTRGQARVSRSGASAQTK